MSQTTITLVITVPDAPGVEQDTLNDMVYSVIVDDAVGGYDWPEIMAEAGIIVPEDWTPTV